MSITIRYEESISKCKGCPFRKNHYGHGECWDYCSHKGSPKGYENIIAGCQQKNEPDFPKWCPFTKDN